MTNAIMMTIVNSVSCIVPNEKPENSNTEIMSQIVNVSPETIVCIKSVTSAL